MISEVYAVYDDASESFSQFMCCQNERIAEMTFKKLFNEKALRMPMLYDYPNTYSVYKVATFDDNSGSFENVVPVKMLLNFGSLETSS